MQSLSNICYIIIFSSEEKKLRGDSLKTTFNMSDTEPTTVNELLEVDIPSNEELFTKIRFCGVERKYGGCVVVCDVHVVNESTILEKKEDKV